MTHILGKDGVAYYNSAGAGITPEVWVPVPELMNVNLGMEGAEADVTTRGGGGWRQIVKTLKDGNIESEMLYEPDNANFTFFQAAFFADDLVEMAFLDGPETDATSEACSPGSRSSTLREPKNLRTR